MKRDIIGKLEAWRTKVARKPLVLSGARQVGKTWILKEFGSRSFEHLAYVALDGNPDVVEFFKAGYSDVRRLVVGLNAATGVPILPGKTLIVLDEIQVCPEALTSLKYWQENGGEYAVVAAGSLLGLQLQTGTGYPVGKTEAMTLYPMSFGEFLSAMGEDSLRGIVASRDWPLVCSFSTRLEEMLKFYLYVGGMPAAVEAFAVNHNLSDAREVQRAILLDYNRDFAKHVPKFQLPRVQALWRSLPLHLSKTDKRFVAAEVDGIRQARDLRDPFIWLENAGLCHRVWNVAKPSIPLAAYRNHLFKFFGVDVGLLSAQSSLSAKTILEGSRIFTEFKGALTEQYVQQELRASGGFEPYFWARPDSQAEVDFLVEAEDGPVPIEAKADRNVKAKSLAVFRDRFHPQLAVRTSLSSYAFKDGLLDIPLYALQALAGEMAEKGPCYG